MNLDQGNGFIEVQGLKCYLPPQPSKHEIINTGLPKKHQKWRRPELPVFTAKDIDIWDGYDYKPDDVISWEEACRQEHIKVFGTDNLDLDKSGNERRVAGVDTDHNYSMECLNSYRAQEISRVRNGVWAYINGTAYYLPGPYYFYLAYWELKDGPPEFRYTDLELFWFWEHVRKSKIFLGIIYITMRGVGKSFVAGCIDYWETIMHRKATTTIQSKSDDDAATFFRDKVLIPVSKLPNFLVPINKHVGDITSLSSLEFTVPARKSMNIRLFNRMKKEALLSKASYTNAGVFAADGGTWDLIVQEEIGKTDANKIADVYKRIMVNKFTVWRGNKKLGNIFASSTVEDMNVGGAECLKVWNESNQYKLNEANTTNTGLARFFRSAIDTTFFDEFGFPEREKSKQHHDAFRKSITDPKDRILYIQKNPYTEEEAFWINIDKCIYNAQILIEAEQRITFSGRNFIRVGDIKWKERDKEAVFTDNENGRWHVSFLDFEPNLVQINQGNNNKTFTPNAAHKRIMGFDPFSRADNANPELEDANEKKGSMAAAAVYNRFDMNIPDEYCDTFIADYLFRTEDSFDSYEDIICGAFFFGCPIFAETNKSNAIDYFRNRGYKWGYDGNPLDFIWERPVSTFTKYSDRATDGLYQTKGTIVHYTESTGNHIEKHGWKLKHPRIIKDWKVFNPLKTKKFDMAVAASMAIVGAERKGTESVKQIDLTNIFRTYDNTGAMSVAR